MRMSLVVCIAILAFVLGILARPVTATDIVTMDGVWWSGVDDGSKVPVVMGMLNAYNTGFIDGTISASRIVTDISPKVALAAVKRQTYPSFSKRLATTRQASQPSMTIIPI